jgi:hypothetical protein
MDKNWNDNNLLPTFKKHSPFKSYGILNFQKLKIHFKVYIYILNYHIKAYNN